MYEEETRKSKIRDGGRYGTNEPSVRSHIDEERPGAKSVAVSGNVSEQAGLSTLGKQTSTRRRCRCAAHRRRSGGRGPETLPWGDRSFAILGAGPEFQRPRFWSQAEKRADDMSEMPPVHARTERPGRGCESSKMKEPARKGPSSPDVIWIKGDVLFGTWSRNRPRPSPTFCPLWAPAISSPVVRPLTTVK